MVMHVRLNDESRLENRDSSVWNKRVCADGSPSAI